MELISDEVQLITVMRGDDYGLPLFTLTPHFLQEHAHLLFVQTIGRFVQQNQILMLHQRLHNGQLLTHAQRI